MIAKYIGPLLFRVRTKECTDEELLFEQQNIFTNFKMENKKVNVIPIMQKVIYIFINHIHVTEHI